MGFVSSLQLCHVGLGSGLCKIGDNRNPAASNAL